MSRFHQRKRAKLENPEIAAAYKEARAEIALQHALDQVRQRRQITKDQLAERMGRHREAISRVLTAEHSNPTLETVTSLLVALDVTADITVRQGGQGESPITVHVSDDISPFATGRQQIDLSFEQVVLSAHISLGVTLNEGAQRLTPTSQNVDVFAAAA